MPATPELALMLLAAAAGLSSPWTLGAPGFGPAVSAAMHDGAGFRDRLQSCGPTVASALAMFVPTSAHGAAKDPEKRTDSSYLLQKLQQWRKASLEHVPGLPDAAAVSIAGWDPHDLSLVIDFLAELASRSGKKIRSTVAKAPIRSRLDLTAQEVKDGELNRVLKQGAMLHTDIALLNLETAANPDQTNLIGTLIDGRVVVRAKKIHWNYARRLINALAPSPSEDPMARWWYIATTASLHSRRHLAYAWDNIESALRLYPSDDRVLLYAGALHETWASPSNQNIQLPSDGRVYYGSKEKELEKAQQLYRKAIAAGGDSAEARLRLGRVLGLLGLHRQALVELRRADALIQDPQLSYYASLFTGYAFEMISRPQEARECYEHAAKLYPSAQSPLLALSQLARNQNKTSDAIENIQRVFALPPASSGADDPFWVYDLSHVRNADALVEEMHRMFGGLPR